MVQALAGGEGHARRIQQVLGPLLGSRDEIAILDDIADEAPGMSFRGVQVTCREHHVLGHGHTNEAREAPEATPSRDAADAELDLTEAGIRRGQTDVTGHRKFQAPSHAISLINATTGTGLACCSYQQGFSDCI